METKCSGKTQSVFGTTKFIFMWLELRWNWLATCSRKSIFTGKRVCNNMERGFEMTSLPKKKIRVHFRKPVTLLRYEGVSTVCEESRCPNRYECSAAGVATFLIGGRVCTRACGFCHILTGKPPAMELFRKKEEKEILDYVTSAHLQAVVITSVARDDDEEGLANHFASITRKLLDARVDVEVLIPDFHANPALLNIIASAKPTVIAQNMETVKRLTKKVRPQAGYERTLNVFRYLKKEHPNIILKSGFMVGLGETLSEIKELLQDLQEAGVEIVTIGQYLRPSQKQLPVEKIYSENEFQDLKMIVQDMGFEAYEIGPFVRSSYMASRTIEAIKQKKAKTAPSRSIPPSYRNIEDKNR
ncbi:MAG: lipoyl synthase [Candidatus Hydrogenedentota bacterium]|nr:MAG: lipoyl synthase [Candidatus Hydrogenedentota bacterium]